MSFASSSNSALVPILPKYPSVNPNSVGYVNELVLITGGSNASGDGFINAFNSVELADGVWLLSGVLEIQAPTNYVSICTGNVLINDVIVSSSISLGASAHTVATLTFSAIITSNLYTPNADVQIKVKCSTGNASTWTIGTGTGSNLKLARIV